jgi:collagenase-like PrtC family protease
MIKILSPLSRVDEVDEVIAAGADEFYCGVMPDDWREQYTVSASLNRRQEDNSVPGTSPHFRSFAELAESVKRAHARGVPVCLTLNEHYYAHYQYPHLFSYIDQALEAEVDALIVGDIALMVTLRERNLPIALHISTAGTAFNAETIRFYQELGASRVILPRHLTLEEITTLAGEVPDMGLEVFILNSRCANVDGFCTFQHGMADLFTDEETKRSYLNACMLPYNIGVYGEQAGKLDPSVKERISWERQSVWSGLHIDDRPCGGCALYEFNQAGVYGVKIVGRENAKSKKIKDVAFIHALRSMLAENGLGKEAFRKRARALYRETYQWPCLIFKCYYPSVLLP